MPNRYVRIAVASTFAVSLAACESNKDTPPPPAAVAPSAPAAVVAAEKAPEQVAAAYVLFTSIVKREASDKAKADDGKGKQVTNWLATLYRGERVTLVSDEAGADFVKIKTSGEVEGFVKRTSVLIAPDVTEATVLESTDAFDRPDLLALNSKKKVTPGTLVFVLKNRDQFSEVNAQGTSTVWVLNPRLTTDKDELAVAKLLAKARSLKESKDDKKTENIADLVALVKNNFGNAKLATLMETELTTTPAATDAAPAVQAAGDKPAEKPAEAKQ